MNPVNVVDLRLGRRTTREQLTDSLAAVEHVDNLLLSVRLDLADLRDCLNHPDHRVILLDEIHQVFAMHRDVVEIIKALSPNDDWKPWPAEAAE
jgi:hypothetical protein